MRLRHVLLITTALGACGAVLLALDFHRRLKEAERTVSVNNMIPGPDSVLGFGMTHALGLFALALMFLALLLTLLFALRDRHFVAQLEGAAPAAGAASQAGVSAAAAPSTAALPVMEAIPVSEAAPALEITSVAEAAPLTPEADAVPDPAAAPPSTTTAQSEETPGSVSS